MKLVSTDGQHLLYVLQYMVHIMTHHSHAKILSNSAKGKMSAMPQNLKP